MMYMIMFVLDNSELLNEILQSWEQNGIRGATIVESTGGYRHMKKHIPMRYAYGDTEDFESGNTTLFVIVNSEEKIQICLDSIENITGNLDNPDTGVFVAWPVIFSKGIPA